MIYCISMHRKFVVTNEIVSRSVVWRIIGGTPIIRHLMRNRLHWRNYCQCFKNILTMRGIRGGYMRRPLLDLTAEQVAELKKEVASYL